MGRVFTTGPRSLAEPKINSKCRGIAGSQADHTPHSSVDDMLFQ